MTNTTRPAYDLASDPRPLWQDGPTRYGAISRLNHWVTAAVFLGAWAWDWSWPMAGSSARPWHP